MAEELLPDPRGPASVRDEIEFPDQGGPEDHTGTDAPQRLPGPVDRRTAQGATSDVAQGELRDDHDFPTAGGPDHHNPLGGGLGQRVPGPANQQPGSHHKTEYPAQGSVRDDHAFLTPGGPDFHTFPLVGRGVRLPGPPEMQTTAGMGPKGKSYFLDEMNWWKGTVTYIDGLTDADGQEWLGGQYTRQALYYDATNDDWHTLANDYTGAGRDGFWYYKGVIADTSNLSFGTLAGGKNHQAWNYVNDVDDLPIRHGSASAEMVIVGDDLLHIYTTSGLSGWQSQYLWSAGRWHLVGDFTITVDFSELSVSGGSSGGFFMEMRHDPAYRWYLQRQTSGNWNSRVMNNNGWATNDNWTSSVASGKFEFSRVGNLWTVRGYNGSSWHAFRTNYAWTTAPVTMLIGVQGDGGRSANVKISNCVVTGGIDNRVPWAVEGEGSHRGAQDGFPQHALIVSTHNSVDIIDVDTDKLWMRTVVGANYALPDYAGDPSQLAMKDGFLLVGMDESDADGCAIHYDFRMDQLQKLRSVGSAYTGAYKVVNNYTDAQWGYTSGDGVIRNRHVGNLHYTGDRDQWQIPNNSVEDVDLYLTLTHRYSFAACGSRVAAHSISLKYDHKASSTSGDNPSYPLYGTSSETNKMYWVHVDDSDGTIYYLDGTALYSAAFSTWSTVLSATGGNWTADTTKPTPGTIYRGAHRRPTKIGNYIYMARVEGIYRIEWPTGSWELFYANSGATWNILPPNIDPAATGYIKDGTTDLLLACMESGSVIAINIATNAIWGMSRIRNRAFFPRNGDGAK